MLTPYVDDRREVVTQPGSFCVVEDLLWVGRDDASPVTKDYTAPYRFTGGSIDKVVVDVSGEPYPRPRRSGARPVQHRLTKGSCMVNSARSRFLVGLVVPAAVVAATVSGCSDTVEEASGDYCSNLDNLESQISGLGALVAGDATLDQFTEAREDVAQAYQDTADAASGLDEAVASEAQSAYDTFQSAVDSIPGDASVSEAASDYASAVQAYVASLATIAQEAGCSE